MQGINQNKCLLENNPIKYSISICIYYASPLAIAKNSSYSSCDPAKLRQLYNLKNITNHSQQIPQHIKCVPSGPYSTTT
jgi:hypothetical protein